MRNLQYEEEVELIPVTIELWAVFYPFLDDEYTYEKVLFTDIKTCTKRYIWLEDEGRLVCAEEFDNIEFYEY